MQVNVSELERSLTTSQNPAARQVKISITGDGFTIEGAGVITFNAAPAQAAPAETATGTDQATSKRGHKRKAAMTTADPELQKEIAKKVESLPKEIKSRFGSVVWAKMRSYPYWPGLIVDPRDLEDPKLQAMALKDIDHKFMVCFYFPRNVCPILFSDVEEWTDTKFDYRAGHPKRDLSTATRRQQLTTAVDLAEKDRLQPIHLRLDGLAKSSGDPSIPPPAPAPAPVPPASQIKITLQPPQGAVAPQQLPVQVSAQFHQPQYPIVVPTSSMPVSMPFAQPMMMTQQMYPFDVPMEQKRKRGRPVGSKNRPKDAPPAEKRKPGRPPGSKTKPKIVPPTMPVVMAHGSEQYLIVPQFVAPSVPVTSTTTVNAGTCQEEVLI